LFIGEACSCRIVQADKTLLHNMICCTPASPDKRRNMAWKTSNSYFVLHCHRDSHCCHLHFRRGVTESVHRRTEYERLHASKNELGYAKRNCTSPYP
jgi:hypothetical protein